MERRNDEQHAGNANTTSISSCKVERGEKKKIPNPHTSISSIPLCAYLDFYLDSQDDANGAESAAYLL